MIKSLKILSLLVASIAMPLTAMEPDSTETTGHTYLFSHGIADSHRQAYKGYVRNNPENNENSNRYIIDNEKHALVTFDYPDAGKGLIYPEIKSWTDLLNFRQNLKKVSYRVDRANTDFAGPKEVEVLAAQLASLKNGSKIGIGVSRGASAWITLFGALKDKEKAPTVNALVLESPFASMDDILRNILGEYLYQYPAARSIGHNLIRFIFSQYKKRAITPIEAATHVPNHLPILIICSAEDTRVPAWSSEKLAIKLQENNRNVHFIKLDRGAHGKIIQGPDGEKYRNAVHAFYKQYGLDYNQDYAEAGKNLL